MLSCLPSATLDQILLREGWSLHARLRHAASQPVMDPLSGDSHLLEAWQTMVAPDRPANFHKRLRWDQLGAEQLAWALHPPDEVIPQEPPWWPTLQALRHAAQEADHGQAIPALAERAADQPFVHVWRPVAGWALQRLQRCCADLPPTLLLSDAAWLDLGEALLVQLCGATDQALWHLFNQRRTPGQMLLAQLRARAGGDGDDACEAYGAFVADLHHSGYELLLCEFPVLGRLLAMVTDVWLSSGEELLRRISRQRDVLQQRFSIPSNQPLVSIRLGVGDRHRGGRSVAILGFGSPDKLSRVVYKPKSMQVDVAYQHFLQHLNEASSLAPLRSLSVVSQADHGFMEWVDHRLCRGENELEQFYRNAGRTVAILYLLGCTDCHFENLIASGDQLILIDTETLLEGELSELITLEAAAPNDASVVQPLIEGSVLRSGLLPRWLMLGAGRKKACDISALGIQPPAPQTEMAGWLQINTDGMMPGHRHEPSRLPTSLPVDFGSPQRLSEFVDPLCEGFTAQLQEISRLRADLLRALESFRGHPRRLVARPTRVYYLIQRQMLEAASLRTAVAHGLKLEQMSRGFLVAAEKPMNWTLFHAEVQQMERFDIPYFEHRIDAESLDLSEGLAPIANYMKRSGLESACRRLEGLDQHEIDLQQRLIRGSIAASRLREGAAPVAPLHSTGVQSREDGGALLTADACLDEAFRLGHELWGESIPDRRGQPEWLGIDLEDDCQSFQFGLIGHSLYSGTTGLALLFARLAMVADVQESALWLQRASACLAGLLQLADEPRSERLYRLVRDQGYGITGTGGMLLALQLLQQGGLDGAEAVAHRLIDQLRPERLQADEVLDLVGGISGLLGPLLNSSHPRARELALVCGEHLLHQQGEDGGWRQASPAASAGRPALTGLSHGAAGIAAALARLAAVSGDSRFAAAVARAVAYERSVFNPVHANWPDFRFTDQPDQFMWSWCHGAPGILLSRLVLQQAGLADPECGREQQRARSSSLKALHRAAMDHRDAPAHHLCCGILGISSTLRVDAAGHSLDLDPGVVQAESATVFQARKQGGYTLFSIETGSLNLPGLFTGKAGVALALAEAATGMQLLPSILTAGLAALE